MAPTIYSDKKEEMHSGIQHMCRRRPRSTQYTKPTSTSSIINYVAKGSSNARATASLRLRGDHLEENAPPSNRSLQGRPFHPPEQLQISDDAVSSTTHADERQSTPPPPTPRSRSASPSSVVSEHSYQYSDATMADDEDDAEVHSIISANCGRSGENPTSDAGAGASEVVVNDGNANRQLLSQSLHLVLNASAYSDKRVVRTNASGHTYSKTYTDICEIKNTEGLLAIAIKTIKLVKRNQLLQRRLAQLQLETSEFIQSVLSNPENRHFREQMQTPKAEKI